MVPESGLLRALKFWMGAVKRKESKALRAREKNAAL